MCMYAFGRENLFYFLESGYYQYLLINNIIFRCHIKYFLSKLHIFIKMMKLLI